jgi:BTG family
MHIEIQVALNFVISYLYNKLPRRRVNIFGEELEKALKQKFQGHWYPDKPFKVSIDFSFLLSPLFLGLSHTLLRCRTSSCPHRPEQKLFSCLLISLGLGLDFDTFLSFILASAVWVVDSQRLFT